MDIAVGGCKVIVKLRFNNEHALFASGWMAGALTKCRLKHNKGPPQDDSMQCESPMLQQQINRQKQWPSTAAELACTV